LVVIADVAGGPWPTRARNAALSLAGVDEAAQPDSDVDAALLSDISQILDACDALAPTAEQLKNNKQIAVEALEALGHGEAQVDARQQRRIVGLGGEQLTNALATFVDRKWPAWDKGKPMRPHQLAKLLGRTKSSPRRCARATRCFAAIRATGSTTPSSATLSALPQLRGLPGVTSLQAQKKLGKTNFPALLRARSVTVQKMPETSINPRLVTL
jgi:hypothetical protein